MEVILIWETVILHGSNNWGITNPSARVSVFRSGRQHGEQGSPKHLAGKDLQSQVGSKADEIPSPAGQSLQQPVPRDIGVAWRSTLVCGAQLSQQWCADCLPSGSFHKCLGTADGNCGISPGAYLWVVPVFWSRGQISQVCFLARWVCFDLGSFPLEPKCHG